MTETRTQKLSFLNSYLAIKSQLLFNKWKMANNLANGKWLMINVATEGSK